MKNNEKNYATMKWRVVWLVALLFPISSVCGQSLNSGEKEENDLRYSMGINYIGGFSDLIDLYEESGYTFSLEWPVGLNLSVESEWDAGFGWEFSLGPGIMVFGDTDAIILPIELLGTYWVETNSDFAPFAKLGGSYLYVSGDEIEGGSFGLKAAVGLSFARLQSVDYGIQISVNTATIDFVGGTYQWNPEKLKPYKYTISIFATF